MSMPEIQRSEPSPDGSRGDTVDMLSTVFRRLEIERLIQEARLLGRAVLDSDGTISMSADITPIEAPVFNVAGARLRTQESAQFWLSSGVEGSTYRVRHDTVVQVEDAVPQRLRREFTLFVRPEGRVRTFVPELSRYAVTTEPLIGEDEYRRIVPNDGSPLSQQQESLLADAQDDAGMIKGFQLGEISSLTTRALASIRRDLTKSP